MENGVGRQVDSQKHHAVVDLCLGGEPSIFLIPNSVRRKKVGVAKKRAAGSPDEDATRAQEHQPAAGPIFMQKMVLT